MKPHARLEMTVYGTPAAQGSKRHVGKGIMVESSKALAPWREDVKQAALRALEATPTWDRQHRHVSITVAFTFARPRSHYRTGTHSNELRADAPNFHGNKPDLDKLARSTGDALASAGVYADDCRVAVLYAIKRYVAEPGTGDIALDRPGAVIVLSGVGSVAR